MPGDVRASAGTGDDPAGSSREPPPARQAAREDQPARRSSTATSLQRFQCFVAANDGLSLAKATGGADNECN